MDSRKNGLLRNAMFIVALFAVITVGFMAFGSEDSYAAPNGTVTCNGEDIGTYTIVDDVLTITATTPTSETSISLDTIDPAEKAAITKVRITGFYGDVTGVFDKSYEALKGNIEYFGDYLYDAKVKNGEWIYQYSTKKLDLRCTDGITTSLGNFSASTAPFIKYFFTNPLSANQTTKIVVDLFTTNGAYVFTGFSKVTDIEFTSYVTAVDNLLNGLDSVSSIKYGSAKGLAPAFFSGLSDTLVSVSAPAATSIGSKTFLNFSELKEIHFSSVSKINNDSAFENCDALVDVSFQNLQEVGNHAFKNCDKLKNFNSPALKVVGSQTFEGCSNLESITFANGASIGNSAFLNCTSLVSISQDSIVSIGSSSFKGCTKLVEAKMSGLYSIGTNAFQGCIKLKTVTVGDDLESVANYAFDGCIELTGIDFKEEGLTEIGSDAFKNCKNLTIDIPTTVKSIGSNAYNGVARLVDDIPFTQDLTFGSSLKKIGDSAFEGTYISQVTFDAESSGISIDTQAFYNCSQLSKVELSGAVLTIGTQAFHMCANLKTVTGWSALEEIGNQAFYSSPLSLTKNIALDNIESVETNAFNSTGISGTLTFSNKLHTIGDSAFNGCSGLTGSLSFPAAMKYIGSSAFNGCSGFDDALTLPERITPDNVSTQPLGNSAFLNCSGFTGNLKLPSNLLIVGDSTFQGCSGFNGTLTLPSGVTYIGTNAFLYCNNLGSFSLPSTVETIKDSAFHDCYNLTVTKGLDLSNVKTLEQEAFRGCRNMTGTLTLPNNVGIIPTHTFYQCSGFTALAKFSNTLVEIRDSAFNGCSGFTGDLDLNKVTTIGTSAFNGCSGFNGELNLGFVQSIGNNAFNGWTSYTGELVLPESLISLGTTVFHNSNWSKVTINSDIESLPTSTFNSCKNLNEVLFNGSIKKLEYRCFFDCDALDSIVLPSSLTNVLGEAFHGCSHLITVKFTGGSSLLSIENDAFVSCTELKYVVTDGFEGIPNASLKGTPFRGCSQLNTVDLPMIKTADNNVVNAFTSLRVLKLSGMPSINATIYNAIKANLVEVDFSGLKSMLAANFFKDFTSLEIVTLNGVPSVQKNTFVNCPKLTTVTMNSATSIGDDAFIDNTSIKNISVRSASTIGNNAFMGCTSLVSVDAPSVTTINSKAFMGCISLTDFNGFVSVETIMDSAFEGCDDLVGVHGELSLPAVTHIYERAFYGCEGINGFVLNYSLMDLKSQALFNQNLKTVGMTDGSGSARYATIDNILYMDNGATIVFSPAKNPSLLNNVGVVETLTIGSTITSISSYAFEGILINSIVIGSGENPPLLKSIGDYAFMNAGLVGHDVENPLIIPSSVSSIGTGAFSGCSGLRSLVLNCTGSKVFSTGAFTGCGLVSLTSDIKLGLVAKDGSAVFDSPSSISNYAFVGSGSSGLDASYYEDNFRSLPWYYTSSTGGASTISIVIDGPSTIDAYMFYSNNNHSRISNVTIEDGVTTIGDRAFGGCAKLDSIEFPSTLTSFENSLVDTTNIRYLTLPININAALFGTVLPMLESVSFIKGSNPAGNMYKDGEVSKIIWNAYVGGVVNTYGVTIESGITSVGDNSYIHASGVLAIPSSVNSIGAKAFIDSGITVLNFIEVNDDGQLKGLETLGNLAFANCGSLNNLILPNTLTSFGVTPFLNCTSLNSVSLPISVKYVEPIFEGCTSLTTFTFTKGTTGNGATYSLNESFDTPWRGISEINDYRIVLSEGITSIGSYTFYGLTESSTNTVCGITGTIKFPSTLLTVGDHAFEGCNKIENFSLNGKLSTIGASVFAGCTKISTLTIGNNSMQIGPSAFKGCIGLSSLTIPIDVNAIGTDGGRPIFEGCNGIDTIVFTGTNGRNYTDENGDLPYTKTPWYYSKANGVTISFDSGLVSIGDYAFRDSGFKGTLTIPSTMESIGTYAFADCKQISKLVIDSAFEGSIGAYAFNGCTRITTLELPISMNVVDNNGVPIFGGCKNINMFEFTGIRGIDYSEDQSGIPYTLTPWYNTSVSFNVTFDQTVSRIGNNMFRDCGMLDGTLLGSGVTELGTNVFQGCLDLDSVSFSSIQQVPNNAFKGCISLQEAILPKATTIGSSAFESSGIIKINNGPMEQKVCLPNVTSIGDRAFAYSSVTAFTIGKNNATFTHFGEEVLLESKWLTSFEIIGTVNSLPKNTFVNDSTSANYSSSLQTITTLGVGTFSAYLGDHFKVLNSVILGDTGLDHNVKGMFQNCVKLSRFDNSRVNLQLPEAAFSGCTSLNYRDGDSGIDISKFNLTSGNEFSGCTGLTSVVLNDDSIPAYSFYGCSNLENIIATNLATVGAYAFAGIKVLTVTDTTFPKLTTIDEGGFSSCGSLTTVNLPGLTNNNVSGGYQFHNCPNLSSVTLPNISVIYEGMFAGDALLNTISADDVERIGSKAFNGCANLSSVSFPEVTVIGDVDASISDVSVKDDYAVFGGCNKLANVTMPNVKSIGAFAFYGCNALNIFSKSAELPAEGVADLNGVTFVGFGAFSNTALNNVTIGSAGTKSFIGDESFKGCSSLNTFTIVGGVESIGSNALTDCSIINILTIPISAEWMSQYKSSTLTSIVFTKGSGTDSELEGYDYEGDAYQNTFWYDSRGFKVVFEEGIKSIGSGMRLAAGGTVTIPSTVTQVGDYAFYGAPMESLVLNDGITHIGKFAFNNCTMLTTATIPNTIVSIGDSAFYGCSKLEVISLPITVDYSKNVFSGCTALRSFTFTKGKDGKGFSGYTKESVKNTPWYTNGSSHDITIGFDNVVSIGNNMFAECSGISGTVNIPSTVNSIGSNAFSGNTSIRTLSIENTSVSIGAAAFAGCNNISNLTIPIGINAVGYNGTNAIFYGCNGLNTLNLIGSGTGYSYSETGATAYDATPWYLSRNNSLSVNLPTTAIFTIGDNMFRGCVGMTQTIVSNHITSVGANAFRESGIGGFTSTVLSSLGAGAFMDAGYLMEVDISVIEGKSVTTIPENAFRGCTSLETVVIDGCVSIGKNAFNGSGITKMGSKGVTGIVLPSVTNIADGAFGGSSVSSVSLGIATKELYIGKAALLDCTSLRTLTINGSVSKLLEDTFSNGDSVSKPRIVSLIANDVRVIECTFKGWLDLSEIQISGTTSLNDGKTDGIFMGCTGLVTVTLCSGDNSVVLPKNAFNGCTSLETINLDSAVLKDGYEFYNCSKLTSVKLNKTLDIPAYSFYGCSSLASVTSSSAKSIGAHAFELSGLTSIPVDAFGNVTSIGDYAFANCGSLNTVMMDSVTSSGDYAFMNCANLRGVSFVAVNDISEGMFHGCEYLATITASVAQSIDVLAFYGCKQLSSVEFPKVSSIGDTSAGAYDSLNDYSDKAVFYGCSNLSSVTMPDLKNVGAFAFYNCERLSSFNKTGTFDLTKVELIRFAAFVNTGVVIADVGAKGGISEIGDYAFYGCASLTDFRSESLTKLPANLFNSSDMASESKVKKLVTMSVPAVVDFGSSLHGCIALTTVDASSATSFCDGTFYGCTNLTNVKLNTSGTTVTLSPYMFHGCEKLSSIDLSNVSLGSDADEDNWADNVFGGCVGLKGVILVKASAIPNNAFEGCINLSSVSAPVATIIGNDAFNGCRTLSSADISDVTIVGDRAFKNCTSLSGINEDTGLSQFINIRSIGTEAFYKCAFTDIVLGPNLIALKDSAFAFNSSMRTLVIPNVSSSVLTIGAMAFQGCPLTEVHISSSVSGIGERFLDYSTIPGQKSVDIWFNGTKNTSFINEGVLATNAIVGNNRMYVNVHADDKSAGVVNDLIKDGIVFNANLDYIKSDSASINVDTDANGTTTFANIFAIYGGKIVLPYITSSDGYKVVGYSTVDGQNNRLAIFASDADFDSGRVARSGDAVPVYPISAHDSMIFRGSSSYTDGDFDYSIVVGTDSYNIEASPMTQTVHYGSTLTMPKFRDSLVNIKGITLMRSDRATYAMDVDVTHILVGYHFSTIVLLSESTLIEIEFIRDGTTYPAEVEIQSPFNVPDDLKYLEQADVGYAFGGWWTSEDGKGIKAGPDTKFSIGQRWYAYFIPLDYVLTIVSDDPEYNATFDIVGPYSLHVVNGSLYYRDTVNTSNVLVYDARTIAGYTVSNYSDRNNFGRQITGDYLGLYGDIIVDLYLTMNMYDLELKFVYNGADISPDESFSILDWDVGVGTQFHTGSVIERIPYSMIQNGLVMPTPVHNEYAFSEMHSSSKTVSFTSGRYLLTLDNFGGQTSTVITYVMEKDRYTIQFQLQDDDDTSFNNSVSILVGESFMMPSVARNYSKTGYTFSHLSIDGIEGTYQERQSVILTQEMADNAKYCVVTVNAIWTPVSYTIGFDLSPYKGTLDSMTQIEVGTEISLPNVTGHSGYRVSGWHWYSASGISDSFEGKVLLTQDVVRDYADGTDIILKVEWAAKTYTLEVDPSTGYKFETKTATFGEDFTLWTNTYSRSFMKFAGWSIGTTLYKDSSTVRVDSVMAAAGDSNNDRVIFSMSWIDNEYQVQYNLDGGEGQIPVDDNAYIVNRTEFNLAESDGSFYQDGYTFVGWKYSKSSYIVYTNTTGLFETVLAQYADENNIVTFYAVWSQKSYKISYDLAGGRAGLHSPTNVFYGDVVDVSKPTRAGYDFAGWTATGLTGGALYSSSAGYRGWDGVKQVTATSFMDLCNIDGGVVTFTAHWEQATYLVSYNLNGGMGVIIGGQIQIKVGDVIQQPDLRDASKNGYNFVGWGVDKVNALPVGSTFTTDMITDAGNTLVLYAVWSPIEYTVQYRYLTDYSYTVLDVKFGDIITLPNMDRPGYTFKGWQITGADSNAYYSKDGSTWYRLATDEVDGMYFRNLTAVDGGVITMEASWSTNEYRISYNSNGGTGKAPVDTNTYRVGDTVQVHDFTVLSGTNGSKSIVGWSLEPNGSSVTISVFTEGLAIQADATGAVNLYAVWVDGMCTVIVDLGDSTASMIPSGWTLNANGTYEKIVDYGSSTKDVMADWENVTIEKDGYNFIGWNFGSATITSTVTVEPGFEEVNMTILYAFGGVVAAFAIGAIFFTRL